LLVVMLWMSMAAAAQSYQVNIDATANGQVTASPSSGLKKGSTVTLKLGWETIEADYEDGMISMTSAGQEMVFSR
jgi:hypothetical protein